MGFELGTYESNHKHITLPNGKPGIEDEQHYALEPIAGGLFVEWHNGKRITIVDEHMKDLDSNLVRKIIGALEAAA